jgi:hypothetical protein
MMNGFRNEPSVGRVLEPNHAAQAFQRVAPAASGGSILKLLLVVGPALGAFMALCLCASLVGVAWRGFLAEQAQIAAVLDTVLGLMRDREIDQAHALFATTAQSRALRSDLEHITTGPSAVLFEGYRSVAVDAANIGLENSPEVTGLVARVMGTVTYDQGYSTTFDAMLLKEAGEWRLINVNVTVPAARLDDFMEGIP